MIAENQKTISLIKLQCVSVEDWYLIDWNMKKTSSQTLKQWHRCESETTQLIDKSCAGTLSEKVEVATTWLAGGPGGAFIHQTCCFIAVKGTRDTLHDCVVIFDMVMGDDSSLINPSDRKCLLHFSPWDTTSMEYVVCVFMWNVYGKIHIMYIWHILCVN